MRAKATRIVPFVPSGADFELAIRFFAELGFEKTWRQADLAGLRFGEASFILQSIDIPVWQTNQMHTVEVDDLDAYWSEIARRDLPARFAGVRTRPPTDFAWGREVHIIDPGGVCWHIRQAVT